MTDAEIRRWVDGWAGSYAWREAIHDGEVTPENLLAQLQALERERTEGTPFAGDWDKVLTVLREEA